MKGHSPIRTVAWIVWLIASIFYAYQYVLRVMPNILLEDIMRQFNISGATFGQFSGVYYIGYSLMHLPLGILLDRFGPRKIMSGAILLTVVGLMPLLLTDYWLYPIVGRFLIGVGSSAAILGVFKVIRMHFEGGLFSRMLSLSVTIGLIGAIYGGGPVSMMREHLGYHTLLQIFAAMGVGLALLTYWLIPELKMEQKERVLTNLAQVLQNKKMLSLCFSAGLMVGPLEGFADVWGTAFLKHVYQIEGSLAASLPSLIFIGMCFGAPLLNFIAEKSRNYLATILGAGVTMAVGFTLLLALRLPSSVLTLNFLVIGVCSAYQILAIYKASTYLSERVAGLTTALANMIIMIFGYAFHSIIGGVVHLFGGPNHSSALFFGVIVIPAALTLGLLGFLFLWLQEKKSINGASIEEQK